MNTNTINDNNNAITFINMYNVDNPILEVGETCYFIFFNSIDYHIPLIAKGRITFDRFNDTVNKHYFISLLELYDEKNIFDKFVFDKQIQLYNYNETTECVSTKPRVYKFTDKFELPFFDNNLMKIECFFVRNNLEAIKELQQDFAKIIREDISKQLLEVNEIIN